MLVSVNTAPFSLWRWREMRLMEIRSITGDGRAWNQTLIYLLCPPPNPSTTRHAQCYQISSPVCQLRVEFISLSLDWRGWNPIWLSLIHHSTHLRRKKKANIQHAGGWGCMEGSNFLLLVPFPSPDYQGVVITNIQSPYFRLGDLRMKTGS